MTTLSFVIDKTIKRKDVHNMSSTITNIKNYRRSREDNKLIQELSEQLLPEYLTTHKFRTDTPSDIVKAKIEESGLDLKEFSKKAEMFPSVMEEILKGNRKPTRSHVIRIAIGLGLSLADTQTLLNDCYYPTLDPHRRRDALIIYGMLRNKTPNEIDRLLKLLLETGLNKI